jgi:hypothetical protein
MSQYVDALIAVIVMSCIIFGIMHCSPLKIRQCLNEICSNSKDDNIDFLCLCPQSTLHHFLRYLVCSFIQGYNVHKLKKKLHGPSPRANYTDLATAACRRSDFQLLRIEGATWSA